MTTRNLNRTTFRPFTISPPTWAGVSLCEAVFRRESVPQACRAAIRTVSGLCPCGWLQAQFFRIEFSGPIPIPRREPGCRVALFEHQHIRTPLSLSMSLECRRSSLPVLRPGEDGDSHRTRQPDIEQHSHWLRLKWMP